MNGTERLFPSLRPIVHEGMVPSLKSKGINMPNDTRELNINELDAVSGGARNQANDIGFHRTFQTSFSNNNGSPLYGNGSFHDTIDNVDGLP